MSKSSRDFWRESFKSSPLRPWPGLRDLAVLALTLLLVGGAGFGLFYLRPRPTVAEPPRHVVVVVYHHLAPREHILNPHNTVSPEMFDQQLGWFKEHGYQTITLPQLYAFMTGRPIPAGPPTESRPVIAWPWRHEPPPARLPAKALVITFDDGYESNYVYAYPVLKKYGFHASIDLIVSTVHDGPAAPFNPAVLSYLNWDEVREMAGSGLVDFQSHTYDLHRAGPDGTPLTLSLPASEVLSDLARASYTIEMKTGQPPLALAYPYGRYTPELERLAHEAGYRLGFTITEGFTRPYDNALAVERFILFMDDTPERLAERFPDQ